MIKVLLAVCFSFLAFTSSAQDHGFKFGQVSISDLILKAYAKDSTANAVVLDEFGESWIDNENDHNLLHEYHVKLKFSTAKLSIRPILVFRYTNRIAKREKVSNS